MNYDIRTRSQGPPKKEYGMNLLVRQGLHNAPETGGDILFKLIGRLLQAIPKRLNSHHEKCRQGPKGV